MTTAQRAAARLDGHRPRGNLILVFPKKPNSPKNIKKIKRLDFQPFFYALVAGIGDMESILADMNPHRDPEARADYDRVTDAVRRVGQAFFNAGYSSKGEPYWADLLGPNDAQIAQIIGASRQCLPIFESYVNILLERSGVSPKNHELFSGAAGRLGAFDAAITGLDDYVRLRRHNRDLGQGTIKVERAANGPMCALA